MNPIVRVHTLITTVLYDVALCSLMGAYERFGENCRLRLKIGMWKLHVLSKRRYLFTKLHGVVIRDTVLFSLTALRISNLILKFLFLQDPS